MSSCAMASAISVLCGATTSQCTIWTRTCVLAHIPTNFPRSSLLASNAAATSASSKNNLTSTTHLTYDRSEEHTSELQSLTNLVCRLLLEKKKKKKKHTNKN